jgi:type II secretory pathway pseudopilin PulG
LNAGKLALIGIVAVVIAAVVAGLVISGSPAEQRRLRADDRRVGDLQQLTRAIQRYYEETERLPETLDALVNGWISSELPRDPDTEAEYDYEITGSSAFRLCAEFARASRPNAEPEFWSHGAGGHCYSLDFSELVLD